MRHTVAMAAAVVVVVMVGVAKGMPLQPEPRKFVYQPGSPSVRLYPVHFEHFVKSSIGRVHLMKEGSPVLQAFRPNMLQPETGKTEGPGDMARSTIITTTMTPELERKPLTTTTTTTTASTTTSVPTTSEPKRVSMTTTMAPVMTSEAVTTLQPRPMAEVEEDTTDVPPSHNLEEAEPVVTEMVLEGDSSTLLKADEEAVSATEIMPLLEEEEEEVESATEFSLDETEATQGRGVTEDAPVTEIIPENEMATDLPSLRELEVF